MMNRDEYYMKRALSLAKRGLGSTNPNPMVGALLVKNNRILSQGYHRRAGQPHAEIEAIKRARRDAKGSTLYVNLEPCTHFGKTPPCIEKIISEGIKKVVIGMRDPNPVNNGKGIKRLQRAGIDVRSGILKRESEALNRIFKTYITKNRPYVTVKIAQSLDGKIATSSGHSKWITNRESRQFVHRLRSRVDAVLVGVKTIIKDDPLLNARIKDAKRQPIRIVLDSGLNIPKDSRVIKERSSKLIVATTENVPPKRARELQKRDIDIIPFKQKRRRVDLKHLLRYLAHIGISHVLVEGGGTVIADFLQNKLVDEMLIFISPKVIGGRDAVTSVEGDGVRLINQAVKLKDIELEKFGEDILIKGYVYWDN